MITRIVADVMNDNSGHRIAVVQGAATDKTAAKAKAAKADKPRAPRKKPIKSLDEITCPGCGKGHLLRGRAAYGCSRYADGCTFRLTFDQYPAELTPAQLAKKSPD